MIKIHWSKDKQFYFTLSGRNGKVIVTSETYKRRRNCVFGIAAMIRALKTKPEVKVIDLTEKAIKKAF
jgi:uncharacterized protein YegP (UPF0339 family)